MGFWAEKEVGKTPSLQNRRGYQGTHGFDVTKLNPACLLFVPSQGAHPEHQFFTDIKDSTRGPMKVYDMLETTIPVPEEERAQPIIINMAPTFNQLAANVSPKMVDLVEALRRDRDADHIRGKQHKIDEAVSRWEREGDLEGRRDHGIFAMALMLRNAGCDAQ